MTRTLEYDLSGLLPYINWGYFFHAWAFPARFATVGNVHDCPACLAAWAASFRAEDRAQADEAVRLYKDATGLLRRLGGKYKARARFGLYAAVSEGDDIWVKVPDDVSTPIYNKEYPPACVRKDRDGAAQVRLPFLRQQHSRDGEPCLCLSDFIAPHDKAAAADGLPVASTIGVFAATADVGPEEQPAGDDYGRMLVQTLCDRLAEAAAERMHEEVRTKFWGYAPDEHLSPAEMFAEKYAGRRPAVGYPSLPDQSLIFLLDRLLDFGQIGITLTENGMMRPHAAVAGLLLGHPATRHFAVGPIDRMQLHDYACRRGLSCDAAAKFLRGNIPASET